MYPISVHSFIHLFFHHASMHLVIHLLLHSWSQPFNHCSITLSIIYHYFFFFYAFAVPSICSAMHPLYLFIHPFTFPCLTNPPYCPSTSLLAEQTRPDRLQTTPRHRMDMSSRRSLAARRPQRSLRWNRQGSTSVMAAPVTLPVRPISRENLGTNWARRNDAISKQPRITITG